MAARPRVLVLLGPTAVGKTAVALALAERLPAEIISADSRQIYAGLTIGSAAPTAAERALVPHHLVGFLDPRTTYSVAEFVAAAEATIADIASRDRLPLLVAGTGLYLRALVTGWTLTGVPRDPVVRARLEAEAVTAGSDALHVRLRGIDPETAARLAPADTKRIVRALEVWEVSGRPLSAHLAVSGTRPVPFDYQLHGLRRPRERLNARIAARLEAMLAAGWLDEVRSLLVAGLAGDEPAFESLGYRALAAVARGELDPDAAQARILIDTRRFAKRQMTWFRALPDVVWHDLDDDEPPATTAERIAEAWAAAAG